MAPLKTFHTSPYKGSGVKGQELNDCYHGDIVDGRRHGQGTYTYANGCFTYQGQYVDGEKHGKGSLTSKDGSSYAGDFARDEITGQGVKRFANGNTYTGAFFRGDLQGQGKLQLASGEEFDGEFLHNCFHGRGKYRFSNGNAYDGEFCKHIISGTGIMAYAGGDRYQGEWVEALRCGTGECTFSSGDTYQGAWRDDTFNGEGVLWAAQQQVTFRGAFVDGKPTTVPTKLSLLWTQETMDPKAAKAAAAATAKKVAGKDDVAPLMPVVLGHPITIPISLAAQLDLPLPPPPPVVPESPRNPLVKGTSGAHPVPPPAPAARGVVPVVPPAPVVVDPEPPPAGRLWATATMEYGRVACLTLHPGVPQPLAGDKAVTVVLAPAEMPDGSVRLLLVLLQVHVEPPLPLGRSSDGSEALYGVRMVMEAGLAVPPQLCLGADPADAERLAVPGGCGVLLASSWGLHPGYMRITLPEATAKKGGKEKGGKEKDKDKG